MTMALDGLADTADDALLIAFGNGDSEAARELTRRLTPRAYAHAFRMVRDRDAAEDIAQEAMIRLWKIAPDWRQGEAQPRTWLYRVVSNLCLDRIRRAKRHVDIDSVDDPVSPAPAAETVMQDQARVDGLEQALANLPDRQREAVILRHLEGLSNPEIAEIMGVGVEAVESLTARGKRALKAQLEGRKDALGYRDDG